MHKISDFLINLKNELLSPQKDKSKIRKIFFSLIFIFSVILLFVLRFTMLLKSSHPTGLDGYYYALQAKSLITNGTLENPDTEIGYYLCGLCSFFVKDAILGCKIWAAIASTLLSVSIFILVKTFSSEKRYIPFTAFVISAFCSPNLAYFEVNYINNLTGLFFFFFFASAFYYLIENFKSLKRKPLYIIITLLLFCGAAFSHLVSFAFAFIFICFVLLRKLKLKYQIIFSVSAVVLFIFIFITQAGRFKNVFSLGPVLPIFSPELKSILGLLMCKELSLYFILSYLSAIFYAIYKKRFDLFLLLPLIISFPLWKLDSVDMGYRMLLNGLPCAICFILIIFSKIAVKNTRGLYAFVLFIFIALSFKIKSNEVYNPKKDPPYEYYKKLVSKINLPDTSLLIAHLGLNHVYTYYCGLKDCLNYNCDFYVPNNEVWRLAYKVDAEYLKCFFGEYEDEELDRLIIQLDTNYVLIKEELWQRYLKYEDDEIVQAINNWYNPHEYRPSFIRKKD